MPDLEVIENVMAEAGGGDAAGDMVEAMMGEVQDKEPLTEDDILTIIKAEMDNSSTGGGESEIDTNREKALDYYLGNPDGREKEGRSQVVSTDVADVIEWILPMIIKALVSKGPVISFDAISDQDEQQAQLETEFTHDVFMKENNGFLNLYQFVKDALMMKNGVLKIYFNDTEEVTTEEYSGLTQQDIMFILSHPDAEIIEGSEYETTDPMTGQTTTLYDVRVSMTSPNGNVVVECVPPEDFRVNKFHNSLDLSEARFCAHVTTKTRSELVDEGYDKDIIYSESENLNRGYDKEFRFSSQDEAGISGQNYSEDESQTLLEVSECYISIDVNQTGVAEPYKITVLGSEEPTAILDMEPMESNPFVSSAVIIMSHKFHGMSMYDRLKQLQDQKTSLWRNIMDNLYLQNNREKEVVEDQVNLDDLITSRPGGVKRVKQPGMIRELQVQPIGQEGFQMLDYLDDVRTGRAGVSPDTASQNLPVGAETAHGLERLQSAKEELVGLMVRVVAETGLKEAYLKIRDNLVKHKNSKTSFKFKDTWVDVNPTQWGKRSRTTINVGTGTGDDMRKQAAIREVLAYQEKIIQDPRQSLVGEEQIYEALDDFCDVAGLDGASKYFLDPQSQKGKAYRKQKQDSNAKNTEEQKQLQMAMAEAQTKLSEAEQMKGQAALMAQDAKIQVEKGKLMMSEAEANADSQIAALKLQLEDQKQQMAALKEEQQLRYKYEELRTNEALKLTEMELQHGRELNAANEQNKEPADGEAQE